MEMGVAVSELSFNGVDFAYRRAGFSGGAGFGRGECC